MRKIKKNLIFIVSLTLIIPVAYAASGAKDLNEILNITSKNSDLNYYALGSNNKESAKQIELSFQSNSTQSTNSDNTKSVISEIGDKPINSTSSTSDSVNANKEASINVNKEDSPVDNSTIKNSTGGSIKERVVGGVVVLAKSEKITSRKPRESVNKVNSNQSDRYTGSAIKLSRAEDDGEALESEGGWDDEGEDD